MSYSLLWFVYSRCQKGCPQQNYIHINKACSRTSNKNANLPSAAPTAVVADFTLYVTTTSSLSLSITSNSERVGLRTYKYLSPCASLMAAIGPG